MINKILISKFSIKVTARRTYYKVDTMTVIITFSREWNKTNTYTL